ncbi:MAG: SMP-30/gluconolactonase/LRE family protein, partial [Rufibacter sp.]
AQSLTLSIQKKIGSGKTQVPKSVAVDAAGNVFITDQFTHQVLKFNPAGVRVAAFGGYGSGAGQFNNPMGVAVDAAGNVYVGDQGNFRIQKFSKGTGETYTAVAQFGAFGSGDGQFGEIEDLAIDLQGNVYVVDHSRHRVQKFSPNGTLLAKFGSYGNGNGQFWSPRGIALDAAGNVYVADDDRQNVQKFRPNSDGSYSYQATFGSGFGTENGKLINPYGVAIDENGNVYVAEKGNNRVQKFSPAGEYLAKFGEKGSSNGKFNEPTDLAFDPDKMLVVLSDSRVQRMTTTGIYSTRLGDDGTSAGNFNNPGHMTTDAEGNLYVSDRSNHRVQKFNEAGVFLTQFGTLGSGDGQFMNPAGIIVDTDGNVYVSDEGNNRIQKFSPTTNGTYVFSGKFGSTGSGNGQLFYPAGLAFDLNGNILVADWMNDRLQKFSPTGQFISVIGGEGGMNGFFDSPMGLATDAAGNLFVVDRGNNRVQKFKVNTDGSYTYLAQMGGFGIDGAFMYQPTTIAVQPNGDVYVVDAGNSRVQLFKPQSNGSYTYQGAFKQTDTGFLRDVFGIATSKTGGLYVTDRSLHQVLHFANTAQGGNMQVKWGGTVIPHNGTFDFGSYAGSTVSFTFRIDNLSATHALEFNGSPKVAVTGPQASAFAPQNAFLPASIDANDFTNLTVQFNPTTGGAQQAQLHIRSNDPQKNPYIINVTGINSVMSSKTELDHNAVTASPNPTTGDVTIKAQAFGNTPVTIQVVDARGTVVVEKVEQFNGEAVKLQLANLPAGIYSIRLQTDKQLVVKKVIKH